MSILDTIKHVQVTHDEYGVELLFLDHRTNTAGEALDIMNALPRGVKTFKVTRTGKEGMEHCVQVVSYLTDGTIETIMSEVNRLKPHMPNLETISGYIRFKKVDLLGIECLHDYYLTEQG